VEARTDCRSVSMTGSLQMHFAHVNGSEMCKATCWRKPSIARGRRHGLRPTSPSRAENCGCAPRTPVGAHGLRVQGRLRPALPVAAAVVITRAHKPVTGRQVRPPYRTRSLPCLAAARGALALCRCGMWHGLGPHDLAVRSWAARWPRGNVESRRNEPKISVCRGANLTPGDKAVRP
jgi:hypothetical protein